MKRTIALVVASAVTLAACGGTDDTDAGGQTAETTVPRTIEVTMTDMAYTPAALDVEAGETVTFVFRNDGTVRHEAVFGSLADQEAHHAEMAEMDEMDGMDGDHGEMDMGSMPHDEMTDLHAIVLEPGETAEITHTFDGATMIGCHEPGHWEAGMRLDIDV